MSPASLFICGFHLKVLSLTFTWCSAVTLMDNEVRKWVKSFKQHLMEAKGILHVEGFKIQEAFLAKIAVLNNEYEMRKSWSSDMQKSCMK